MVPGSCLILADAMVDELMVGSDSCLSQHDVTGPKAIDCQRVQEVAKVLGTIRAFVNINWRLATNKHGYFVGRRNCPALSVQGNSLLSLLSNIQVAAPVLSGQFGREHIHIFNLRWFC